ncbi:DUF4041 domain-containing protein [Corynebacterium sp. p3-SID1145]|uniref:DUF4041 domain-containing protein n=1 Tax=unclassified Corynebacterium TaxID=2624378 RepID=UPI0021AA1558|nr:MULTISPECIES: DUF4041 domain-containing protein [unclassified Corynebacterium]MCT1452839.1 DUF4041 domain-containing protein [Corynebacterium sp. p3-SID1145]MCT1461755.1 DUF4041 domain-containing protein [Corynebacterium sp. p3-SID1140]
MFGRQAKQENEVLRAENQELRNRLAYAEQILHNTNGGDLTLINQHRELLQSEVDALQSSQRTAEERLRQAEVEFDNVQAKIIDARDEQRLQDFGWFEFENPAEHALELEEKLKQVRAEAKEMVRNKVAVSATEGFTFNNSLSKGKSFVNNLSKMALRSYNAEVENAITRMKAGNLSSAIKRVDRARLQISKMGSMIDLGVTREYHRLRIEELKLASEHLKAKQAAKEAEREEKARLREEKKAQAELEAERKRLEKEKNHYQNALSKLLADGKEEEAQTLREQINEIQKGIENVDYRQANIRAGYVYVISNLGSFGERMVKIGMTRRLDPMDRVRELSDASVPFNFDVHALHFSNDAVGIENALHQKFAGRKVNRINNRREFFYATPGEVKDALLAVEGNLLEYIDVPEAEQFRLSQAIIKEENQPSGR